MKKSTLSYIVTKCYYLEIFEKLKREAVQLCAVSLHLSTKEQFTNINTSKVLDVRGN